METLDELHKRDPGKGAVKARTPMLQQYFRAKEEHPGVLLAMRVGDFYEFYGEDAETAASALEITLTGREDGENGRISMAGVPFHSVEKYLARLLSGGHKVALCDQLEDPKAAKGLVKRGVTRVLTPGTVVEDSMLPSGQNNFLAAICVMDGRAGLATLDPSTGEFVVTEVEGDQLEDRLIQELARLRPSELLVGPKAESFGEIAKVGIGSTITDSPVLAPDRAARKLLEQFEVANLQGFGVQDKPSAIIAASMILSYAEKNRLSLAHVESLTSYSVDGFMGLDLATRKSLELSQNMADGSRRYTLLSVLDETMTPMGSRLIRRWIEQPLLDISPIRARLDAVERLLSQGMVRGEIRDTLKRVTDIERLVSRASTGYAGPRDMAALRQSLFSLPSLAEPLRKIGLGRIQELREMISDHSELAVLLQRAIVNEPPHTLREGGYIKADFDNELDQLRDLNKNGKQYIAKLEQQERERSGISTLKVGYNAVFGYYLEVSKSQTAKVPADYIRKQTTANAERYITAELKEHETLVVSADEKAVALEQDLFYRLRTRVAEHSKALLQTARALAELDVLASLAEVAAFRGYVKPELVEQDVLEIESGRHPVVEANATRFVPNDVWLGGEGTGSEGEGAGFRVQGSGDRVSGSGGQGSGPEGEGAGSEGEGAGFRVQGSGSEGLCSGFQGSGEEGSGYRVQGSGSEGVGSDSEKTEVESRALQHGSETPSHVTRHTSPDAAIRAIILTGPNMSGKSTYLRQTALITLMAQIGSFVPAKKCTVGLCDRIFARIGAKDELALGQSTFMVEMIESANILNHASPRSLVILDEVGRGTSTYDGLAIAWAMVEYLAGVGCKTMFATHYHQLNALAEQISSVANFRVSVEEIGDDVIWTHKVLPGGTDRSYGIHVARMAGIPAVVLKRSAEILAELEQTSVAPKAETPQTQKLQLTLFEFEDPPMVRELQDLDVNQLTPLEALKLLDSWKKKFVKS